MSFLHPVNDPASPTVCEWDDSNALGDTLSVADQIDGDFWGKGFPS